MHEATEDMEPDGTEEPDETDETDRTEESDGLEETDELEESDGLEESDELEEADAGFFPGSRRVRNHPVGIPGTPGPFPFRR